MNPRIRGVLAPVVTPFAEDFSPDAGRLQRHCRWLLAQDVGLAIFGTNSEANSLSVDERISLLDHLVASGIPPARMMPGTGCCAITDSIRLTAHAVRLGVAGCLMLPPFYYKGVLGRGPVSQLRDHRRQGRRRAVAHLPVSHPAGVAGRHQPGADRAVVARLSDGDRRRQGFLRRLEQHAGDAGAIRGRRIRRVRGQRVVSGGEHAGRGRRLHQRDGQCEPTPDRSRPIANGKGAAPMDCSPNSTPSARPFRSIR